MKILASLLAIPLAGCSYMPQILAGTEGSGHARTEVRTVSAFTAIRHNAIGDMDIRVGQARKLTITADDNLLPKIRTSVEKGVLVISAVDNPKPNTPIRLTVGVPALDGIELNGVGDIKASRIHGRTLNVKLNGVGDLRADGAVDELSLELNGVGNAELAGLTARQAVVRSQGTGDASVQATKRLRILLDGVGNVTYRGKPQALDIQKHGVGDVKAG